MAVSSMKYGLWGLHSILVVLLFTFSARGAEYPLILEDGAAAAALPDAGKLPDGFPLAQRWRPVILTPRIAAPEHLAEGDTLALDLFDDAAYTARLDRITVNVAGTVSIRGRIDGHPPGYVLVSTTGGRSLGAIHIPEQGRHFIIQSEEHTRQHYLLDVEDDRVDEAPCHDAPIPPPPTPEEVHEAQMQAEIASTGPFDPATIDVMIVYTPAARQWANSSGGGIANVVAQSMQRAQLSHDNSNTVLSLNLVHSAEVDYVETGEGGVDLRRLTASPTFNPWGNYWNGYYIPGHMDEVHSWRDQYGADLVALFTSVSGYGGIAWLLNTTAGRPQYGFSVTRIQQSHTTSYTHSHELGHNMGCHHHKEQNFQPGPGLFSYSAGWRWIGSNGSRYCTVMAYTGGQYYDDGLTHSRVAHFSNPNILYWNVPTGHAADGDNARTIRASKHVIANYRISNLPPETPTLISPSNGAVNLILTPTLQASAFSDPDGDAHANSHWQVSRNSGFTDLAWDGGESAPAATQVTLAPGVLRGSRTYHWRVRYKDHRGEWSNWSSPRSFSTRLAGDFDGDGDVDQEDFGRFQRCLVGFVPQTEPACAPALLDGNAYVDQDDFIIFQGCMSGANIPADPTCAD